ncbi:MAG: CvpA family protein [Eubacterium sp.]
MNWILIISILVVALSAFEGYKRGFVKMAFSMVATILIIILTYALTPTVSDIIAETDIYTGIRSQIETYINEYIDDDSTNISQAGLSVQKTEINKLPIPKNLRNSLIENNTEAVYRELGVENFKAYIAESLTHMILNAITFFALFIILTALIRGLIALLDIISKLPIVNFFNRTLGTAFGLAQGIIILWIACLVLTAFGTTHWGKYALEQINNSQILSFVYNNNLLLKIVTSIFS